MTESVYIIHTREFINSNQNVYKIGRTSQEFIKRATSYPKGSILKLQKQVKNSKQIESIIKSCFNKKFKIRKDIGIEYFEGNYNEMEEEFMYICIANDTEEEQNQTSININDESDNDDIDKIETNHDDDDDDDDDYKQEEIEINTCEEYLKFSKIYKITITNKKTKEGFLKFKNHNWRKLYNRNSKDFDEDNMETLDDFIKTEQNYDDFGYKDSETNAVITFSEFRNLYKGQQNDVLHKYKIIDLKYNFENIIEDIINKCYVKPPIYYELKYHEFTFHGKNNDCHESKDVIYNTIENTFVDTEDYDKYGILYVPFRFTINYLPVNNDTSIVETILNSLVKKKQKLIDYKKLYHSVFVNQSNDTNIFYDYYGDYSSDALLTTWLKDTWYILTGTESLSSESYYEDCAFYNKEIKNKKHRFVVITQNRLYSIDKMITDFKSKGIKNIIVKIKSSQNNSYDINNFLKYLNDNKDLIIPYLPNNYTDLFDCRILYDSIFSCQKGMPLQFVMWGCSV
jgi:hypothetical protein